MDGSNLFLFLLISSCHFTLQKSDPESTIPETPIEDDHDYHSQYLFLFLAGKNRICKSFYKIK